MSTDDPTENQDLNFGKALEEIEEIAQWFERGDVDLELAIEKYRRGMGLLKKCKERLQNVENELLDINKEFADSAQMKDE